MRIVAVALPLLAMGCSAPPQSPAAVRANAGDRAADELTQATQVLDEMPAIPSARRDLCRCVVVVPSLVRAGLFVGGRRGDGVVSCRTPTGWSAPAFVSISGGSAGIQIGLESSDVVMLIMTERAKTLLFQGNFAIGADASAAAGPVGEAKEVATDVNVRTEILAYARSRGLFAGVELSGAVMKQDTAALVATYGQDPPSVRAILMGETTTPPVAPTFLTKLAAAFPRPPTEHTGG
ncbi:MAG TPA: lipid-binding SYLF domain-containing protein [Polyangiaceae bacterium]|nr:lipid-binding SYLF domain-containing protein [Polyangiaceae bacterium]